MNWKNNKGLIVSGLLMVGLICGWWFWTYQINQKPELGNNYFGSEINNFCLNDICLKKNSDKWIVDNGVIKAPANIEMVNTYLDKFKNINLGEVVSINKNNFSQYGMGSDKVIIKINNKSLELGKINASYNGTYIKNDNEDVIHYLDMIIDKKQIVLWDQWVNKSVTNLPITEAKKLTLLFDNRKIELEPKNGKWSDEKMVNKAMYLEAIKYLPNFDKGNDKFYTLEIGTETKNIKLNIGRKQIDWKNTLFWATNNDQDFYEISKEDFVLLTGKLK